MPNQMPPSDIAPSDLWIRITEAPRPHELVPLPRKGADGKSIGELAMVVLTQTESQAATLSTERWVRKLMKDGGSLPGASERSEGYTTLYETRATLEVLFRCCKNPSDPDLKKPFFPSPDAIGEKLTTDECGVLFREYILVRSKIGPIVSQMSDDEYHAWVEVLAKGGLAYPLASMNSAVQIELMQRMAADLMNSRTDRSSPGTQLESTG